jgi:hypothetical protein
MVMGETCCSIDLNIRVYHSFTDLLLEQERGVVVFVEDIIVARPVEEVYNWTTWIRRHSVLFVLEHVAVHLRARASVKIYDLDSESDRLQEDIDEKHDAQMVDLLIRGLEPLLAVSINPQVSLYKVLIRCGIAL